jgi:hypothetical protein
MGSRANKYHICRRFVALTLPYATTYLRMLTKVWHRLTSVLSSSDGHNLSRISNVNELVLSRCPNITDEHLAHIEHIRKLRLDTMKSISGYGFRYLNSLVELELIFCSSNIGDYLHYIPHLRSLTIQSYPSRLTQVQQLRQLQRLLIEDCHKIKDVDIYLPSLHTLSVIDCRSITVRGVQQIPNLTLVNFYQFGQNDNLIVEQLKTDKYRKVTTCFRSKSLPNMFVTRPYRPRLIEDNRTCTTM